MKYEIKEFDGVDKDGNIERKLKLVKVCSITGKEYSTIIPAKLFDNIDECILSEVLPLHTKEERWFIESGETPEEAKESFNPTEDEMF